RARALRANLTDAERALWQKIRGRQLGAKFRRQAPVGPYIADFLSHEARLVIEVDGGQHGATEEYDVNRTAYIEEQGFKVLRFWNSEILENMDGVLIRVMEVLRASPSGLSLSPPPDLTSFPPPDLTSFPPPDLPPRTGGGMQAGDLPSQAEGGTLAGAKRRTGRGTLAEDERHEGEGNARKRRQEG
ncbi:MAG TPA: endonuclease domain-containing protein, partial [Devosia sp.]|nr:endonuclease domain-containing protein [Devosia sp.]